ncbi:hypothetical protein LC607_30295 [Nostoc sp. CHAB 5824]|nr:hypothetical protein [Nostoc sp. CHAB 5824]
MEPVSITTIIGFIFTKVAETLIGKATEAVLPKISELRHNIISRLEKYPKAKAEIENFKGGSEANLKVLETYLNLEIVEDNEFAQQVQNIANEINQEFEKQGQGSNIMNVFGGKAYQQNQNKGEIYNADSINIHKSP